MKRNISVLFILWVSVVSLFAIPAKKVLKEVLQIDGTTLTIRLCGDEYFHYYSTLDGYPLVHAEDGGYYYALMSSDSLCAGTMLAHNEADRSATEQSFVTIQKALVLESISESHAKKMSLRNAQYSTSSFRSKAQTKGTQFTAYEGNKRGLIILVSFSDLDFTIASPQQTFHAMTNEVNYKGNNQYGSVHDYFYSQSAGKFSLNFDVVGPVKLSKKMSYYGADSGGTGYDIRPGTMVAEACVLANDIVNYSDYDWDNDGVVDQVYVVYAGYGQSSGASSSTIWPHAWELSLSDYNKTLLLDNVVIDKYACGMELSDNSGSVVDGIGTICHEFSHCLGLPDVYDTQGNNFGMSFWSLMDSGSYNGDGNVPCGYTSYERMFCGWLNPIELNSPCTISDMEALCERGDAYIIYNEANKNEYYLLENRQKVGWDSEVYGHGLLVIHVDYDKDVWEENRVNVSYSHPRCTIIAADNDYSGVTASLAGDPYPGTSKNTSLTDTSIPAAKLFNLNKDARKYMGKPIEMITEKDGKISFRFMGGLQLEVPQALPATHLNEHGFTAHWSSVVDATSYVLRVISTDESQTTMTTLLSEGFDSFYSTYLGSTDLSNVIDQYTTESGWNASKIYTSSYGAKLGSSSTPGSVTTPLLHSVSGGDVQVSILGMTYKVGATTVIDVRILSNSGEVLQSKTCSLVDGNDEALEVCFTNAPASYRIQIAPQARIYLRGVEVMGASSEQVTIVEGITDTQYEFTDVASTKYAYSVKAVSENGESDWSNTIEVDLLSDINEITSENLSAEDVIEVYTLSGIKIKECRYGVWSAELSSGLYIVKAAHRSYVKYLP